MNRRLLGFCLTAVMLGALYYGISVSRIPYRLRESIRTGDFATFSSLLRSSDVTSPHRLSIDNTMYLIHFACADSRLESVGLLLDKGANIHQRDSHGKTCIFHAVGSNNIDASLDIVGRLHRHDPTVLSDHEPVNGDSVLHYAVRIGADGRIIEKLLHLGIDKNSVNTNGETPLQIYRNRNRKEPAVESMLK